MNLRNCVCHFLFFFIDRMCYFPHVSPAHRQVSYSLFFFLSGFKCPVCSKFVSSDEMDLHLVLCLTKPRVTYNGRTNHSHWIHFTNLKKACVCRLGQRVRKKGKQIASSLLTLTLVFCRTISWSCQLRTHEASFFKPDTLMYLSLCSAVHCGPATPLTILVRSMLHEFFSFLEISHKAFISQNKSWLTSF